MWLKCHLQHRTSWDCTVQQGLLLPLPKALIAGAAFLGLPLPQRQVAHLPETDAGCPPLSRERSVWGCFTTCACLVLGIQARVGSPVSQSPVLLVRQQDGPSQTP